MHSNAHFTFGDTAGCLLDDTNALLFSDISGFLAYFSRSLKRTATLDKIVVGRLCVATFIVYDMHILLECFTTLQAS